MLQSSVCFRCKRRCKRSKNFDGFDLWNETPWCQDRSGNDVYRCRPGYFIDGRQYI